MIIRVLRIVPAPYRRLLPRYLALIVVFALAQSTAYVVLVPLLDAFFTGDRASAWSWTAWLAGIIAAVVITGYAQSVLGLRIGAGMLHDLQTRLGERVGTMPLGWFGPDTAGRVSRLISTSSHDLMGVFAHLLTPLLTGILIPAGVAVGMLWVDWRISLAMLISAPVLFFVNRWATSLYARAERTSHRAAEESNARVIEFAQAQPVLRAFGVASSGQRRLDAALTEQLRANRRLVWSAVPGMVLFALVVQLTFVVLVFLAVNLVSGGDISAAAGVALIAVSSRFIEPLNDAASMATAVRGASQAGERITALLAEEGFEESASSAIPGRPDVRFDHVDFSYRDGEPVLSDVDFVVPEGTTTAIVGPSGSGKSTILRLAARFYDADSGVVSVAGSPVGHFASEDLMREVSLVFQDVYLFRQSIIDNIRVGRPDASDAEIERVARIARVDEIIERLPEGWSTDVGEGGAALSGGERQRVSIARALLKDAPIVLLDEATSALDPQNEAAVVRGLSDLSRGKTVIVVAHRLSTIRHADQILFLDEGRIIERGTHEELVAKEGRYAAFWHERSRASGWRLENTGETTSTTGARA